MDQSTTDSAPASVPMKRCRKCGEEKSLSAFAIQRENGRPYASCRECKRAADRARAAADPEANRAKARAWYYANPDRAKAARRDWWQRNRGGQVARLRARYQLYVDEARAAGKARYAANKRRVNETHRRYYEAHRQQIAAATRDWRRRNLLLVQVYRERYRSRRANAPVCDLTAPEWRAIQATYGHRCAYCGERWPLTQDHVIPLSRGGAHTASNIVPACRSCNARKGDRQAPTFQPLLLLEANDVSHRD